MRLLLGVVSPLLLLVALVAAATSLLLITPGRNLTDADAFAAATARAVVSAEGRAAVADELTVGIAASTGLPEGAIAPAVDAAADAAASDALFVEGVEAGARASHRDVVAPDPSDTVAVPLGAVASPFTARVASIDPRLAGLLPADEAFGTLTLAKGPPVRWIGRLGNAAGRPGALAAAILLAVGAGSAGLLVARRRASAATAFGVGLLVVAALPVAIAWVARPVAEWLAGVSGQAALAGVLASELLAVDPAAPVVVACAGGALIVVGMASRLR